MTSSGAYGARVIILVLTMLGMIIIILVAGNAHVYGVMRYMCFGVACSYFGAAFLTRKAEQEINAWEVGIWFTPVAVIIALASFIGGRDHIAELSWTFLVIVVSSIVSLLILRRDI